MTEAPTVLDFLTDRRRLLPAVHLSVVGSSVNRPIIEVDEIDLHVVIPMMSYAAYQDLCFRGQELCTQLRSVTRESWRVETRRGPFKPDPVHERSFQVHLLIDDLATLQRVPEVTLLDWRNNGAHLFGQPMLELRSMGTVGTAHEALRSCAAELREMQRGLDERCRRYKMWTFLDGPKLDSFSEPLSTPWSMRCLLKYTVVVGDTITRLALDPSSRAGNGVETHPPIDPAITGALGQWGSLPELWSVIVPIAQARLAGHLHSLGSVDD